MQHIGSFVRIFCFLITIFLLQISLPDKLHAQTETITLSFDNISLRDAIKKVEAATTLQFVFADALLKNKPLVTGSYQHATVAQVLNAILIQNGITYKQQGNNIILHKLADPPATIKSIISGTITDSKSNEPLIGALIHVGAITVQTDIEGKFNLTLPVGMYQVEISYLGYKAVTQSIQLSEGKETQINVSMSENPNTISEVSIIERRYNNTNMALIESIKDARSIVNGISREQITRSQDRDAAEVVRRVAGVSVMQNRFIVVRGMGQRYNTVMLNNALAPSFEPDSRAFSFDIIPSGMIDRILVYKTAVPELPGDFAGGLIKVYTTGAPVKNGFNISYQAYYRPSTTFKDFYGQIDGKYAWLGYDDGTYKKPIDYSIPQNTSFESRMETTRKFNQNWVAEKKGMSLPDQRLNIDFSRIIPTSNGVKLGVTGGLSYSNSRQYQVQYRNPRSSGSMRYTATDQLYSRDIRLSGLMNISMNIGSNHQITFKNLYTHMGSTRYMYRRGYVPSDDMAEVGIPQGSNLEQFVQTNDFRGIYTGQINGTHQLFDGQTKINWLASYTRSDFYAPDERRRTHTAPYGTENWGPWLAANSGLGTEGREQRIYWSVPEAVKTIGLDWEQKLNIGSFLPLLKAGFYYEDKDRSASYIAYAHIDSALVGGRGGGFNDYAANNLLKAGYIAAEIPFLKKFKLYGGVRVEHNRQQLTTISRDVAGPNAGTTVVVDLDKTSLLPSANLSYNFSDKTLIRFAWYRTLNRPEFREISNTQYYDMANNSYIYGNPQLVTQADIDNVDLRLEHYPGPGEMITFALFHKKIANPYELYSMASTGGISYIWQNSATARNYGVEVDMMLGLGRYINGSSVLAAQMQKISVLFNAAYIYSRLELGEAQRFEQETDHRPLMGQSPYLINTSINYTDDSLGLKLNMSYNVIGKRIAVIGNRRLTAVWELPRNSLDFTFSKKLGKIFELKGGIQNILNSRIVFAQDMNQDGKFDIVDTDYEPMTPKQHDNRFMSTYDDPYFSLGITVRL